MPKPMWCTLTNHLCMVDITISKNGIPIRLTDERWGHIINKHPDLANRQLELLQAITEPNRILEGSEQELLAISEFTPGKWLVVAYREFEDDGFIITAYLTRKIRSLNRRRQLWP